MAAQKILSVGIDIGTSTTQVVFSSILMDNTAGFFQVPRVSILVKDVIYKSRIYETPLKTPELIDGDEVRNIVADEYQNAGFQMKDVTTGAVIITGEAARKENAAVVLEKLSSFAGDFVVSTAGPDLEAIIAGKGSGAWQASVNEAYPVVNLDIGGGTSNIVEFREGRVMAKGCVDIGGRNLKLSKDGEITYISDAASIIAAEAGLSCKRGERPGKAELEALCRRMAGLLWQLIKGEMSPLLEKVMTPGSTPYCGHAPKTVYFSGGVADSIYRRQSEDFPYGDIGVLLGRAIRDSSDYSLYRMSPPSETIRATVVGAGSHMVSVSGSTIYYSSPSLFPLKNLPVLEIKDEWEHCLKGDSSGLKGKIRWLRDQADAGQMILYVPGLRNIGYLELKTGAEALASAFRDLPPEMKMIICLEADYAKALGQTIRLFEKTRSIVCIDSVYAEDGNYMDIGAPIMNGLVVPVVIKTLIFG